MTDGMKNTTNPMDDEIRFDRLVDGQLSGDEYRALLASFDDEPGAWKKCALAFLEAQALASELGGIRRSLDLHNDSAADLQPAPRRHAMWGDVPPLLAVAASFLLA